MNGGNALGLGVTIGTFLFTTPLGWIILGLFLLTNAFVVVTFGLCCIFAPHLLALMAFSLMGAGVLIKPIIPILWLRIAVGVGLIVFGIIVYIWPGTIGLSPGIGMIDFAVATMGVSVSTTPRRRQGTCNRGISMLRKTQLTNRTRYDWLVDKEPSNLRFTKVGDVSTGIQVRMELKATIPTFVIVPFPIPFVDMATLRAFLARKARVDINNGLSDRLGFVVYEGLELSKGPSTEHGVEVMPKPFLSLNSEGFECNDIKGLLDYLFCDAVVHISHKPFLSTYKFSQLAFGRTSAFGLQNTAIVLIPSLHLSNLLTIDEFIIGEDCMIIDARIDTENFTVLGSNLSWGVDFCLHPNDEPASIERYCGGFDFPVEVFTEIIWHFDWNLYPPMYAGEGHDGLIYVERESPHVVPDCTVLPLGWQSPSLLSFEHIGGLVTGSCSEGGRESVFLSYVVVCGMMEFEFIPSSKIESNTEYVISGIVEYLDSFDNSTVGFCIDFDSSLHSNTSLHSGVYKHLGQVTESKKGTTAVPPTAKASGFPRGGIL